VDSGKFRGDLYYRLNVVTISLPPLRERADDIPLLAHFFAQKYGAAQGKPAIGISAEAMDLITRYGWPGNVRELEHVIERAVVLTPHPVIFPEDLPEALRENPVVNSQPRSGWVTLDELERDYILRALAAHQQDQGKTADLLGIHRKTLQRKLRKYGLADAGAIEEVSTGDQPAVEQEESI
jgi:DNA-binding NtrC family response regulator